MWSRRDTRPSTRYLSCTWLLGIGDDGVLKGVAGRPSPAESGSLCCLPSLSTDRNMAAAEPCGADWAAFPSASSLASRTHVLDKSLAGGTVGSSSFIISNSYSRTGLPPSSPGGDNATHACDTPISKGASFFGMPGRSNGRRNSALLSEYDELMPASLRT